VVEVWPGPEGPVDAVLAFTAHHVVAAGVDPDLVAAWLPEGDLGAPMSPGFLIWLGERLGSHPGSLDLVLAAPGLGGAPPLDLRPVEDPARHPRGGRGPRAPRAPPRRAAPRAARRPVEDPARHPRAARAQRYRRDLRVWTDPDGAGVLVLGRGLAGRREVSFEVDPARRNRGLGRLPGGGAPHP